MSVLRVTVAAVVASAVLCAAPAPAPARIPASFWGVNPVAVPTDAQVQQIAEGGVGSIRIPLDWSSLQPAAGVQPQWASFDRLVEGPARERLQALPVIWGSPSWVASRQLDLPRGPRQLKAWKALLRAAVMRYGPGGTFWVEHAAGSSDPVPYKPIRIWQIWNEPNTFYFTNPVSPAAYAKLVVASRAAISSVDPRAQLMLGGMFGKPSRKPPRVYSAWAFLKKLYQRKGVKRSFDGVALHPYARSARDMTPQIKSLRATMKAHGDSRTGLWITELGWGSAAHGPYQKGLKGQARELSRAFSILLGGRKRWRLKGIDWYSLTDDLGPQASSFGRSAGLFTAGFQPKPAWARFKALAGGGA